MNNSKTIDLRSDTVTRPTAGMRRAMAEAVVGDDVFGDDPTVARLQEAIAQRLDKPAALFVPSGTMANQVAVRLHCAPGDELLCEAGSHVYQYEQGGFAQLSGVVAQTVPGTAGAVRLEQLEPLVRREDDHFVRTRLVCFENTHNRGGGSVQPFDEIVRCCQWAHERGLKTHLDGARLFNAVVASGISASDWARPFDTVSVCFSKGLGAPVGSAIVGSEADIRRARRIRKLLGGGMRQVGILAAGALYALEHHVDRLADDHRHAQQLAAAIEAIPGLKLASHEIPTNIVFFEVEPDVGSAVELAEQLRSEGLLLLAESPTRLRALTHLDIGADDIGLAAEVLRRVVSRLVAQSARTAR